MVDICYLDQLSCCHGDSNSSYLGDGMACAHRETSCMGRCCRCLAAVPGSALLCWLLLVVSVADCGGALLVAVHRTTSLLDRGTIFVHAEAVCLGVIFGMVLLATVFLIAATFTSRPLSADFLSSNKRTRCVKAWLIIKMLLLLLLLTGWLGVAIVLTFPLAVLAMIYTHYYSGQDCINLKHYLLTPTNAEFCGNSFSRLYEQSEGVFECYVIALVGALLVILSLVFYLMYTAANYIQIKESTPSEYSVYKNEVLGANKPLSGSILDTRM